MKYMPKNSGLTLIEMMVAVAILVIMIVLVGYVFNAVSKAVDVTSQQMARDIGIQTLYQKVEADLHNINKDGFLCLVQGVEVNPPNLPFQGYRFPPAIIFTAQGHYVGPNSGFSGNAALLAFMPIIEAPKGVVLASARNKATGLCDMPMPWATR